MTARQSLKLKLLAQFGSACQRCGYSRCVRALQFHHRDASTKTEWNRGRARPGSAAFTQVAAHPELFLLLCANCHFEEHDEQDRASQTFAKCQHCHERFTVNPYKLRDNRAKFCSRKCYHLARRAIQLSGASVVPRFWRYANAEFGDDACWIWTGTTVRGYPSLQTRTERGMTSISAKRIAYQIQYGFPPPANLSSCRKSPTPEFRQLCVNPVHLSPRTAKK